MINKDLVDVSNSHILGLLLVKGDRKEMKNKKLSKLQRLAWLSITRALKPCPTTGNFWQIQWISTIILIYNISKFVQNIK